MDPTAEGVRAAIEDAWSDARYPGDDRLAGRPDCCGEYGYVATYFRGRDWRDVDPESLRREYEGPDYACLSFMGEEAFRFYLGAFMRMAVAHVEEPDMLFDAAVSALLPPRYDPAIARIAGPTYSEASMARLRAWWERRADGFSDAQRRAIVAFLEFMGCRRPDPASGEALAYWRSVSARTGAGGR